jgi:hypothetical protein
MARRTPVTAAAIAALGAVCLGLAAATPASAALASSKRPVGSVTASSVSAATSASRISVSLYFRGGDGLLLAGRGATARLSVGARTGSRDIRVPGTLRYTSSAPTAVSVSADQRGAALERQP